MTRQLRIDEPDTWHHVMNRGIARRPIFENQTDVRKFLAGRSVRVGPAVTLVLVGVVLVTMSIIATLVPSLQAARTNPARVMRAE